MPNPGYEIHVRGHLPPEWSDWFDGLAVTLTPDGDTLLSGPVPDQVALHGLLARVRDLGLVLVSLQPIESSSDTPISHDPAPRNTSGK
jgi:hypothetical protein